MTVNMLTALQTGPVKVCLNEQKSVQAITSVETYTKGQCGRLYISKSLMATGAESSTETAL